ncbi:starch synthase catalytic domain protein, partial [Vibrio parahaemolyticus V-223/04]
RFCLSTGMAMIPFLLIQKASFQFIMRSLKAYLVTTTYSVCLSFTAETFPMLR